MCTRGDRGLVESRGTFAMSHLIALMRLANVHTGGLNCRGLQFGNSLIHTMDLIVQLFQCILLVVNAKAKSNHFCLGRLVGRANIVRHRLHRLFKGSKPNRKRLKCRLNGIMRR